MKAKMPNVCRQRALSSFCVFVMENYFYIILTPGRRLKVCPVWGRLHLLFIVSFGSLKCLERLSLGSEVVSVLFCSEWSRAAINHDLTLSPYVPVKTQEVN